MSSPSPPPSPPLPVDSLDFDSQWQPTAPLRRSSSLSSIEPIFWSEESLTDSADDTSGEGDAKVLTYAVKHGPSEAICCECASSPDPSNRMCAAFWVNFPAVPSVCGAYRLCAYRYSSLCDQSYDLNRVLRQETSFPAYLDAKASHDDFMVAVDIAGFHLARMAHLRILPTAMSDECVYPSRGFVSNLDLSVAEILALWRVRTKVYRINSDIMEMSQQ